MNSNLDKIIIRICSILNKHSVQYLIVGGSAVALHGYFRDSINQAGLTTDKPDLDCSYNPTYDNYFRLLDAYARCSKYQPFQNYKTAGINKEPDFIRGRR